MSVSLERLLNAINATNRQNTVIEEENLYVEGQLEKSIQVEDLKLRRESLNLAVQNRTERKKYAKHIFLFTCIWATFIFLIVLLSGIRTINGKQFFLVSISDRVLITLITSTTINFFGFFLLVVKYLFHVSPADKPIRTVAVKRRSKATEVGD